MAEKVACQHFNMVIFKYCTYYLANTSIQNDDSELNEGTGDGGGKNLFTTDSINNIEYTVFPQLQSKTDLLYQILCLYL